MASRQDGMKMSASNNIEMQVTSVQSSLPVDTQCFITVFYDNLIYNKNFALPKIITFVKYINSCNKSYRW